MRAVVVELQAYARYVVSAQDAAMLLDIARRSIPVNREQYGDPLKQAPDQAMMVSVSLDDYEPLRLPEDLPTPPQDIPF